MVNVIWLVKVHENLLKVDFHMFTLQYNTIIIFVLIRTTFNINLKCEWF